MDEKMRYVWVLMSAALMAGYAVGQTATPTALVLDYDLSLVPQNLKPGDTKPIYIVVKNTGGLPAREVRVTLPTQGGGIQTEGPSSDSVSSSGDWFLGTINAGTMARIVSNLRIDEDARVGTHYLTLYMTYDESRYDAAGRLKIEQETTKWIIPVEVSSGSLLELEGYDISGEELKAGDNIKLSVKLANSGEADAFDVSSYLGMPKDGSAANTQVNSELSQAFTVLGSVDKKMGDILKKEQGMVEMTIHIDEDIDSKAYTLPITAEYEDKSGTEHTDIFYVGVYVSGERKLAVTNFETDPAQIHSDEEDVEFTGLIENQGTEQVKNVKVTFSPEKPLVNARSYIQTKEVGILQGGDSQSFTFYADVQEDVDPQQTKVRFLVDYEVNSQKFHDEIEYSVDILDHPRFKITALSEPTLPNDKGTAKVTVENVGSECDGVTLIILEKRDQPFDFDDKSAYIGDVGDGERGSASITYSVEDKAVPQTHIIPLEVRCTKDDEVLVFSKTIRLGVGEKDVKNDPTVAVLGITGLFVAAAYMSYRTGHTRGHRKCQRENKK